MENKNERIVSLLSDLEEMFEEQTDISLCEWNSLDGDDPDCFYHRGRMDQTMFLRKKVRRILSDVIIRHLDSAQGMPGGAS